MQMIEFVEAIPWRECQCCHGSENVVEIYFRNDNGQGVCVALCDSCRDVLVNRLTERVKPKIARAATGVVWAHWYKCGACGLAIDGGDKFCRHCGKGIEWEGEDDAE